MTRKSTKALLITAASAAALLSASADRAQSQGGLFDPESWTKQGLKAVFGRALQRRLTIDGDLDVDFGSTLRIVAEEVAVQNVDWASRPHMLTIGRLTFAIDLVRLAAGEIAIAEVRIEDPSVFVERNEQGEVNWQTVLRGEVIEPPPELEVDPEENAGEDDGGGVPAIRDLLIRDARISYLDHVADREVEARLDRVAGSTGTGDDPASLTATGTLAGLPLEARLEAGSLGADPEGGRAPVEMLVQVGGAELAVEGSAADLLALRGLDLRASFESERPARLLRIVEPRPPALPSLAWSGRITRSGETWTVQEVDARLGESMISGEVRLDLAGTRPAVRADLAAERIVHADLRKLAEATGALVGTDEDGYEDERPEGDAGGPELIVSEGSDPALDPAAIPDIEADLVVTVDRFDGPEMTLRDVRLAADLHDRLPRLALQAAGQYRGEPLEVLAKLGAREGPEKPGAYPVSVRVDGPANQLAIEGSVRAPIPLRGVELGLEVRSTAPEPWLELVGLTGYRPGRVLGTAHLTGENAAWRLTDVYLEVGQSNLFGELEADLSGEAPAIRGDLTSNRLIVEDFTGTPDEPAAGPPDQDPTLEEPGLEPQVLPDVHADLDLTVEYLEAAQLWLDNLTLDLELRNRLPVIDLSAEGRLQREPVRVALRAGTDAGDGSPVRPYPVHLEVVGDQTSVRATGTVAEPLRLDGLDVDVRLEGPTLDRLGEIAQLALPSTPPYRLTSNLARDGRRWTLTGLDGRIGDSDLAGDVTVDLAAERPTLIAELRSRSLDFDDLGPLVGAAPDIEGDEAASERQERRAAIAAADRWVLPDDPIDLSELRSMDAQVTFTGERVVAPNLPLEQVRIEAVLDDGRLRLEPVRFEMADGSLEGEIALDARDRPLQGRFDVALRNLKLNQFLKQFEVEIADLEVEREGRGTLHGRASLETRGDTIHEMAASADGRLALVMDGGRINALIVEAAGLDVGEIIAVLLAGEPGPDMLPIECFIGNFRIREGVMRARPLVLKAPDDTILGTGAIDLGRETFDLALEAEPTDVSVLSASTPIRIEGPWTDPSIIPTTEELVGKGIAAAGLGIVIPFVGALIPFVEIGDGGDGACAKLLANAPEVD